LFEDGTFSDVGTCNDLGHIQVNDKQYCICNEQHSTIDYIGFTEYTASIIKSHYRYPEYLEADGLLFSYFIQKRHRSIENHSGMVYSHYMNAEGFTPSMIPEHSLWMYMDPTTNKRNRERIQGIVDAAYKYIDLYYQRI
jgi:hypothetical protein